MLVYPKRLYRRLHSFKPRRGEQAKTISVPQQQHRNGIQTHDEHEERPIESPALCDHDCDYSAEAATQPQVASPVSRPNLITAMRTIEWATPNYFRCEYILANRTLQGRGL